MEKMMTGAAASQPIGQDEELPSAETLIARAKAMIPVLRERA